MSRAMRDSGIFDGVKIPITWNTIKFGKICSVVTDFVASGSFADLKANVTYLSEPNYAMLVRTADLAKTARSVGKIYISQTSYEFLSNSNLFGGEIVLPNVGSIGNVYIVPKLYERMSLAPNAIMFKTRYYDKYYYYYFLCKIGRIQLSEISQSTAMAKFNKTDLKQIRVFLPSLSEQKAIADFLDKKCAEIDNLVAVQEQMLEELRAYKQSLITETVTHGLNPSAPMRDSGIPWIGKIPEHWEVVYGKKVYLVNDGGVWGEDADGIDDTIVLRSTEQDIDGHLVISEPAKRKLSRKEFEAAKLMDGDLIITKSSGSPSHIGKTSLISKSIAELNCCFSNFIQRLRVNGYPLFYWFLLNSVVVKKQFEYLSTTTTGINNINSKTLDNLLFPTPSLAEQKAIADFLDKKCAEIDELIATKQQKIETLKEYKKSIIYEYVTGKKEVE